MMTAPDGALWFTTYDDGTIGRTTTGGVTTCLSSPAVSRSPIVTGADGNLRLAASGGLVRLTPHGLASMFAIPAPTRAGPAALMLGRDGDVWFTDPLNDAVGLMTPDGAAEEFTVPNQPSPSYGPQPIDIVLAADGNLWFNEKCTITPPPSMTDELMRLS